MRAFRVKGTDNKKYAWRDDKNREREKGKSGDSRTILDCHHVAITETNIIRNVPYPEYEMNSP